MKKAAKFLLIFFCFSCNNVTKIVVEEIVIPKILNISNNSIETYYNTYSQNKLAKSISVTKHYFNDTESDIDTIITIYKYDNNGDLISEAKFYPSDTLNPYITYINYYNNERDQIKSVTINSKKDTVRLLEYKYKDHDVTYRKHWFVVDYNELYDTIYNEENYISYNDKGLRTYEIHIDKKKNSRDSIAYFFLDTTLTNTISYYTNGIAIDFKKTNYQYYGDTLKTELTTTSFSDTISYDLFQYKNGKITKSKSYNKGEFNWIKYAEYDNNQKVITDITLDMSVNKYFCLYNKYDSQGNLVESKEAIKDK